MRISNLGHAPEVFERPDLDPQQSRDPEKPAHKSVRRRDGFQFGKT